MGQDVARNQGDCNCTRARARKLARSREADDGVGELGAQELLGYIALAEGDYVLATAHIQEALALAEALGARRQIALTLSDLGMAAIGREILGERQRRLRMRLRSSARRALRLT